MTCPKCTKPASGLYCQGCGNCVMPDVLAKQEAATKTYTSSEMTQANNRAMAYATRIAQQKYEAIIADQAEKSAQAYNHLSKQYDSLMSAYVELKDELSKVTTELTSAVTGTNTASNVAK